MQTDVNHQPAGTFSRHTGTAKQIKDSNHSTTHTLPQYNIDSIISDQILDSVITS